MPAAKSARKDSRPEKSKRSLEKTQLGINVANCTGLAYLYSMHLSFKRILEKVYLVLFLSEAKTRKTITPTVVVLRVLVATVVVYVVHNQTLLVAMNTTTVGGIYVYRAETNYSALTFQRSGKLEGIPGIVFQNQRQKRHSLLLIVGVLFATAVV